MKLGSEHIITMNDCAEKEAERTMKLDDSHWDQLIGDLYDAITAPEYFDRAVSAFERCIDSDGFYLFSAHMCGAACFTATNIDWVEAATFTNYHEHYIHQDPRKAVIDAVPIAKAFKCSHFFDNRFVENNGFYQDWLIPAGARFVAGGALLRTLEFNSYCAFNRRLGRVDFDDHEVKLLGRYLPHLSRAVRLMLEHQNLKLQVTAGALVLEQQTFGVVGLNQHHRVVYANATGQRCMAQWREGGFNGGGLRLDGELAQAVDLAHASRQPQVLRRVDDERDSVVSVWPVPRLGQEPWLSSWMPSDTVPLHTLVVFKVIAPGVGVTHQMLIQLYGLSPAESRLAGELMRGQSMDDYAQNFNVSVNTARTQLRAVLAKTGFKRQQELVRMLAALPAGLR